MALTPAIADAYRNVLVTTPTTYGGVGGTATSKEVGGTLNLDAGFGITLVTDVSDPANPKITIVNTGNGTGALTTITDSNASATYYPIFTRAPGPGDINVPTGTYQMDTMYLDQTTTPMTYNPSTSTLTAATFSGNLTGNASTVTNGVVTTGSYSDPSWLSISATKVGLGNVTNESKATMFTSPTFTGTVDLSSIQTSATNITIQTGSAFGDPGFTRGKIELANNGYNDYIVPNTGYTHRFYIGSTNTFSIPGTIGVNGYALTTDGAGSSAWTQITATTVGLGNVTNESKATMFSSPTFTGTVSGITKSMVGLGNITIDAAGSFITSGAFSTTITATNTTSVTLPTSGTLYGTATGSITSAQLATSISDETGSGALVFGTSPTISGTATSITNVGTFALRDTSAAFDLTLAATSSTALTAGRTLTLDVVNAARTVKLAGNIDIAGTLTTANTFTTSGNFGLTLTTTNTTNATLPPGTITLYGTGTSTITSSQLATSLSDETGSGAVVFGTNPTLASPTYGNASSTTDADATVDAAVTTFYAYIQSASATTRTINISNLTAGRSIKLYLRNTNAAAKVVNIAASTTTTGFAAVNLATSNGAASATSVTLALTNGTALVTVFNANGTIGGGM